MQPNITDLPFVASCGGRKSCEGKERSIEADEDGVGKLLIDADD